MGQVTSKKEVPCPYLKRLHFIGSKNIIFVRQKHSLLFVISCCFWMKEDPKGGPLQSEMTGRKLVDWGTSGREPVAWQKRDVQDGGAMRKVDLEKLWQKKSEVMLSMNRIFIPSFKHDYQAPAVCPGLGAEEKVHSDPKESSVRYPTSPWCLMEWIFWRWYRNAQKFAKTGRGWEHRRLPVGTATPHIHKGKTQCVGSHFS